MNKITVIILLLIVFGSLLNAQINEYTSVNKYSYVSNVDSLDKSELKSKVCPTVGIHYEISSVSYDFPVSLSCASTDWLFIRTNSAAVAGGTLSPAMSIEINPTNSQLTGNNVYGYEQHGTWDNYWSFLNIAPGSISTNSMYEVDNSTSTALGIELCDVYTDVDMPYTINDVACGGIITSGTWFANDGSNSGPAGPTGNPPASGCQFISFPTSSVKGTALYSCPTCPVGSFDYSYQSFGWGFFNPSIAGPGTYYVTFSFDNTCAAPDNCYGTTTVQITVTNPYTFTSLSYSSPVCKSTGGSISPVLNATTGGVYTSIPSGLSINSSTGVINVAASNAGTYTVTYSVGTLPCGASGSSTVTIIAAPTVANAGTDQSVCGTSATLAGNTATVGTGTWTLVSGSGTISAPNSPTSGVTGLGVGVNTFQWTIANSPCPSSSDQVSITAAATPTVANAGIDQSVCGTSATFAGNTATVGTGTWTLVSGSGTISAPNSPTSGITGLGVGVNTFQWTIANSPCPSSSDQVSITGVASPTVANAGIDQAVCGTSATFAG
ncbi:MAG: hypothetical protein ABIJ97_02760, partial [Bacteroidota bacterium]